MAACTGLIVANIYYCQPLIVLISQEFKVEESRAGVITFLTQIGYAMGLLFFVPLGDKIERRKQILFTSSCAMVALLVAANAPSLLILEIASLLIGFTSVVPQLILPLSASLASPAKRGRVIGIVMSGLLIGVLLSRTLSGFVGAWLGWRSMYWIAAGIMLCLILLMRFAFPVNRPSFTGSYGQLMKSLLTLIRELPLLREASAINALAFAVFGMFWTTMVLHMSGPPFGYHSDKLGLFGLAAAAGALAAPVVGAAADKRNPRFAIGLGIALVITGYLIFHFLPHSLIAIIAGIVVMDLGAQAIHVSNQSRVYALLPEARNRLNTVFMTISFIGTSFGSALGLFMWRQAGWNGVTLAGISCMLMALLIFRFTRKG
ncbi:MFS transporter [Filimonas effusa]|uniref:MFS transporter n=2 Tax=Filimonas effusa TaxID=2508721 RepID=A0A4Q1DFK5_9BACT|nr:MFS transporter [Filimonas effusa]